MTRASLAVVFAFVSAFATLAAPGCKKSGQAPSPAPAGSPSTPSGGMSPGSPPGSPACAQPEAGQPMTSDQCTCLGGRVSASRGGEQEHCTPGETELGTVSLGVEGGWCCKAH